MAFYVGCYLIQQDVLEPLHTGAWVMPSAPQQHMGETSNVEELHILPTEMDSIPTQIQYGAGTWTDDEGFTPDALAFDQFYVSEEFFYVRGFTAGTGHYLEFYPDGTAFYVRSWTSATELYSQFYVKTQESFYVRGWTSASDLYGQFYVKTQESFYVRGFTPLDFFYTTAWSDC